MAKPFTVTPQERARPLSCVGEYITVLASSAATEGYEIFLQEGPEASGPPPHSHTWDESFYVIRGNIEFGTGDTKSLAAPGTLVHVPAGTVHWFRFAEGGGQMLSITGEGSNASTFFADVDKEVPPGPPDIEILDRVAKRCGLQIHA